MTTSSTIFTITSSPRGLHAKFCELQLTKKTPKLESGLIDAASQCSGQIRFTFFVGSGD